jgi:hypothetical protein
LYALPIRHVLSICAPVYRISSPQAQGKVDVSLFILLEYVVLTMQHWPFCLSPETPPSEDAAQNSQNRGFIRPRHSNFSLPPQCRAMAQIYAQEWDGGCKSDRSVGGRILASVWLVQHAHVPGKTAPTNFKRALVLGQFAQPSPAPYSHIASSQEHELSSSCSFY